MKTKINICTVLLMVFLILVFLLSVKVTTRYSRVYLDGDTSADILLSHELYKNKEIMSKDWYYGSEPRILHNPLIFVPLFNLFSDWTMVRITGTVILQILMVLSFIYMMKKAGQKSHQIILGAILLLLPFNIYYGRFVLYQVFYITYVSYGFLMIGLFFSFVNYCEKKKTFKKWFCFVLLLLMSFLTSLQGYRPLITITIPLLLIIILFILRKSSCEQEKVSLTSILHTSAKWLLPSVSMLIMGLLGIIVYIFYILKKYSCMDYAGFETGFITIENLWNVIFDIFLQFGYREKVSVSSLLGILSIGSIYTAAYAIVNGFKTLFNDDKSIELNKTVILRGMMITGFAAIVLVNVLTNSNMNARYMIPPAVWMIPLICSYFDADISQLSVRQLLNLVCLFFFMGNSLVNSMVYLERPEVADLSQKASSSYPKLAEKPIKFLLENGYSYGLADHWQASVISELTDGDIIVSSITWYNSGLRWFNMLTAESFRHLPVDKAFIIVDNKAVEWFESLDVTFPKEAVYRDESFTIYDIPDINSLRDYLDHNRMDGNARIPWPVK